MLRLGHETIEAYVCFICIVHIYSNLILNHLNENNHQQNNKSMWSLIRFRTLHSFRTIFFRQLTNKTSYWLHFRQQKPFQFSIAIFFLRNRKEFWIQTLSSEQFDPAPLRIEKISHERVFVECDFLWWILTTSSSNFSLQSKMIFLSSELLKLSSYTAPRLV